MTPAGVGVPGVRQACRTERAHQNPAIAPIGPRGMAMQYPGARMAAPQPQATVTLGPERSGGWWCCRRRTGPGNPWPQV